MALQVALSIPVAMVAVCLAAVPALAQKQGGTLRIYHRDNLPSGSIHEEATISTVQPFMGVFNNLVIYDQHKRLNAPDTIVPDLAESWAWDASKTKLTFKLRQGVKWHDGKPFSAKDVQCTWNKLTGKDNDDFRNPTPLGAGKGVRWFATTTTTGTSLRRMRSHEDRNHRRRKYGNDTGSPPRSAGP